MGHQEQQPQGHGRRLRCCGVALGQAVCRGLKGQVRQGLWLEQCLSHKPVEAVTILGTHRYVLVLFVCHPKGGCGLSPLQAGHCMGPVSLLRGGKTESFSPSPADICQPSSQ